MDGDSWSEQLHSVSKIVHMVGPGLPDKYLGTFSLTPLCYNSPNIHSSFHQYALITLFGRDKVELINCWRFVSVWILKQQ